MSELNSSTLFYHVKKEYQSRNIQNHMYTTINYCEFSHARFPRWKDRREFKNISVIMYPIFIHTHFALSSLKEKKYFQQQHEKSTCKLMPIVGGFVYFLRLDLIEVLRHKSPLEMTNFSDPNNSGNGSTTNFFSIGGTKKTE